MRTIPVDQRPSLRKRARILLHGAASDVVLAMVAFPWGDRGLPTERVRGLDRAPGQLVGAGLLIISAGQFPHHARVKSRMEHVLSPEQIR